MANTTKLLVKVEEAAEVLGIGRSKLYELLYRDEIRSVKIDGCRRVPVSALDEYVCRLMAEQYPHEAA